MVCVGSVSGGSPTVTDVLSLSSLSCQLWLWEQVRVSASKIRRKWSIGRTHIQQTGCVMVRHCHRQRKKGAFLFRIRRRIYEDSLTSSEV